jgi:hypothetical protein
METFNSAHEENMVEMSEDIQEDEWANEGTSEDGKTEENLLKPEETGEASLDSDLSKETEINTEGTTAVEKNLSEERCRLLEKLLLNTQKELEKKEQRLKTLQGKIVWKSKSIKDHIRGLREAIQEPRHEEQGQTWRIVEELDQNLGGFLLPEPEYKLYAVAAVGKNDHIPMVTLAWSTEEMQIDNMEEPKTRNIMNVEMDIRSRGIKDMLLSLMEFSMSRKDGSIITVKLLMNTLDAIRPGKRTKVQIFSEEKEIEGKKLKILVNGLATGGFSKRKSHMKDDSPKREKQD